jgi:hypothetical protein
MATQFNNSMVSEVSICNQALGWLGASQITSLDDPSTNANLCRNNYPFIRDAVLEERMWSFAVARATSTVADLDEWGKMYVHQFPLEWLQVFRAYCDVSAKDPSGWVKSEGWRTEGNSVLSYDSTIYLWGVRRITDTNKFSQLFVQTVATRMAAELAMPITNNRRLQVDYWTLYEGKLATASTRDGQQGSNERIRSSALVDVRR